MRPAPNIKPETWAGTNWKLPKKKTNGGIRNSKAEDIRDMQAIKKMLARR